MLSTHVVYTCILEYEDHCSDNGVWIQWKNEFHPLNFNPNFFPKLFTNELDYPKIKY